MNFKYVLFLMIFVSCISCKENLEDTAITNTEDTKAVEQSLITQTTSTTNQSALVEYYESKNGIPIYNGFINADTTNVAAGNKYIIDVVAYELWGKFLYLNKNYEVTATDKPESITLGDLGTYHPYLVRVTVMPKPISIQNAQEVEIGFSEMGIPSIHRTDFLKARLDGWNQQLSTKKNFAACTENDLRCNAERVLETVVASMFR